MDIYNMCFQFSITILIFFTTKLSFGQDSVAYEKDFRLYEGLYISYQDFRYNWPIPKEKIITKINKDQLDFYSKLIEDEFIDYYDRDSSVTKIKSNQVWGYCQNNMIFINQNNNFYRIPVFGAISNFIGTVEVINYSPGFDPFMNAPMGSRAYKTKELRQFMFNFYTGEIVEFNIDTLSQWLKNDAQIYSEFIALSKKKKKEFATRYIRLYNEKNKVYFPKG